MWNVKSAAKVLVSVVTKTRTLQTRLSLTLQLLLLLTDAEDLTEVQAEIGPRIY